MGMLRWELCVYNRARQQLCIWCHVNTYQNPMAIIKSEDKSTTIITRMIHAIILSVESGVIVLEQQVPIHQKTQDVVRRVQFFEKSVFHFVSEHFRQIIDRLVRFFKKKNSPTVRHSLM